MPVVVITDSAANLPLDLVEQHRIRVVPMVLKFGDRLLRDGVDIPQGSFYAALVEEQVPVSTSAPSAGDFGEAFERALGSADGAVCVTVASFVSASFEAAAGAAREFGGRVRVVDSKSASLGEGFAALEGARLAAGGADLDAVTARAQDVATRATLVATINTFEFLRKTGRVNALFAYAGTALNIKPVFAFRGGKLEQLGRPRTRARAVERMMVEVRAPDGLLHVGVVHADCSEEADVLRAQIEDEVSTAEILVSEFTPLMGAHTGPGVLGVAFWG
ncbi:MAG: DegV family protein [Actinomycetota bacterium]